MIKKMMLLAMAVGMLAVPGIASAQVLEDEAGVVEPESTILATSVNTETVTSTGTLSCGKVTLDLTVGLNEPGNATAAGNGTAAPCKITQNGAPVTITGITVSHLNVGEGVGSASFTFTSDIAGVLECTFSTFNDEVEPKNSDLVGITYEIPSDVVHIAGTVKGTGAGCPATGAISGDFTLETGNGSPVSLVS